MPAKNEILEELRSLSTVLPIASRETPYTGVPDGYFRDLPELILNRVRVPEQGLPSLPRGAGASLPFQVPDGYFEGLAGSILDRIKAGQGAKVYVGESAAAGRSEAAEELALLSPLLSGISRKTPYQAPEGYFDELSPILAGLREQPVYEVPEGYFEELAGQIVSRVQPTPVGVQHTLADVQHRPAKVVTMGRSRTWWKYSAAAVVAAFVLSLGWLRLHKAPSGAGTPDIASNLNKVSDQEIESYLDNHSVPLAETISNSTATLDIDDSDIKSLLGDVPDAELRQYLEDQAGAKDIVTN